MAAGGEQPEDPEQEEARARAAVALKYKEKNKAAAEEQAARQAMIEEKKRAEAEAEALAWEMAKTDVAARAAAKEEEARQKPPPTPAEAVLHAMDTLATQLEEMEEHTKRLARLEKVLGDTAVAAQAKSRRKSRDLMDELAQVMDGHLEQVFQQFDTDGSGALDVDELAAAYKAAGMTISEEKLYKCIKTFDTNGDGVIDLAEFKEIAIKMKTV